MVLTEFGAGRTPLMELVNGQLKSAGVAPILFDGGEPEPSVAAAQRAIDVAKSEQPDAIIGLGGGSSIDLAKMTAVVARFGGQPKLLWIR